MLEPLLCVICVCLSGFYAPLTMGQPPAVPYVLITPGARRRQCLAVYVTGVKAGTWERASRGRCLCTCVYVPPLFWSADGMWMGSLCGQKKGGSHFYHQGSGCGSFLWKAAGGGLWTAWPCFLHSAPSPSCKPDSEQQREKIRQAPRGGQVRGRIISDMGFLLGTYSAFTHS